MPGLIRQELYDFLTSGRRLLKLATLTEDGTPYVVPLWYDYDGEAFSVAGRRRASLGREHPYRDVRESGRLQSDTDEAAYVRVVFQGLRRDPGRRLANTRRRRAPYVTNGRGGRPALLRGDAPQEPRALVRIVPESVQSFGPVPAGTRATASSKGTSAHYPTITMCTSPGPCTPVTSWYSMSAERLGPVMMFM